MPRLSIGIHFPSFHLYESQVLNLNVAQAPSEAGSSTKKRMERAITAGIRFAGPNPLCSNLLQTESTTSLLQPWAAWRRFSLQCGFSHSWPKIDLGLSMMRWRGRKRAFLLHPPHPWDCCLCLHLQLPSPGSSQRSQAQSSNTSKEEVLYMLKLSS